MNRGPSHPASASRLKKELAIVFGVSVLATGGVTLLQQFVPWVGGWSWLVVALVFLVLPTWVVRRFRDEEPEDAGMRFGSVGRGMLVAMVLTLLTLAPFALGYHFWATHVWSRTASLDLDNYRQWPVEIEGRPPAVDSQESGLWIWSQGKRLRVWWRSDQPVVLRIAGDLDVTGRGSRTEVVETDEGLMVESPRGLHGVDLVADGFVQVSAADGDWTNGSVQLGASGASTGLPWEGEREWWWLLSLLLTQMVFVALPEEYFYRGYVQETLRRIRGRPADRDRRADAPGWLRGLFVPEVVIGSILFALGHFLIDWNVARLAVFFPSLVFGVARQRTNGLIAPIVYHGMCNLMVELLAVHYS